MCGIAGILDPTVENKETVIGKMVAEIRHRGPDQDGFFTDQAAGLGMRRLSIIDLSTGKQPIWSQDGTKCIFFNGEIYNYLELRDELSRDGATFSTHSDTEVILAMYEKYGPDSVVRLRGMFAFAIYDIRAKTIFLARDFFGIKPLYYAKRGERVTAFASEIKSFFKIPNFPKEVNDRAVYNYLSFQYNPLDETFFTYVFKLPPGHSMTVDLISGQADIRQYWKFVFDPAALKSAPSAEEEAKLAEKVRETVEDSVRHHMIADVPVGSFLSGGVDSSIIAASMQKIRGEKKIKTFTVGWKTFSEGKEAAETSDFLETDHTEITIGPEEYFDILPKVAWHFDEPVADPSAIGLFFLSREARKHVTVVLSGEGADELFGGYNIYLAPFAYRKIAWLPRFLLRAALTLPFGFFGKNYIRRAYYKLEDWYIGNASIFKPVEAARLWKGEAPKPFSLSEIYAAAEGISDSAKMQYIDIHTWLVGDILAKADKMTMVNSLELRVPFLDTEVAQLAERLPDALKWKGGQTKYILRQAFEKVIPDSARRRKKLGFPTPVREWFTADRKDLYGKITENIYIRSRFREEEIKKLIEDHTAGRFDNSRKIYLLLMLALWYDAFMLTNNTNAIE